MNHLTRVAAPTIKSNWRPSFALLNNSKESKMKTLNKSGNVLTRRYNNNNDLKMHLIAGIFIYVHLP